MPYATSRISANGARRLGYQGGSYIIYDGTKYYAVYGGDGSNNYMTLAKSTDFSTWSLTVVDTNVVGYYYGNKSIHKYGSRLVIVYHDNYDDLVYKYSDDDGASWSAKTTITAGTIPYFAACQTGSTVHIFYCDYDRYYYLYYKRLDISSLTISSEVQVTNFGNIYFGWCGNCYVDSKGRIHLAFSRYNTSTAAYENIYYIYSDDGGVTWKSVTGAAVTLPLAATSAVKTGTLRVTGVTADDQGRPIITYIASDGPHLFYWDGSQWVDKLLSPPVVDTLKFKDIAFFLYKGGALAAYAVYWDGSSASSDELVLLVTRDMGSTLQYIRLTSNTVDDTYVLQSNALYSGKLLTIWVCGFANAYPQPVCAAYYDVGVAYSLNLADSTTVGDALAKSAVAVVSDTPLLSDVFSRYFSGSRSFADTPVLTDSVLKSPAHTVSDAVSALDYSFRAPVKSLADAASGVDVATKLASKTVRDATSLPDSLVKAVEHWLADATEALDATYRAPSKILVDAPVIADLLAHSSLKAVGDTLSTLDAFSRAFSGVRALADVLEPLDTLAKGLSRGLGDFARPTDVLARSLEKTLADAEAVADYIVKTAGKALSDAHALTDALLRQSLKQAVDALTASDYMFKSPVKPLVDLEYVEDQPTARSLVRALTDTAQHVDTVFKEYVKQVADAEKLTDYMYRSLSKLYTDVAELYDTLSRGVSIPLMDQAVPEFQATGFLGKTLVDVVTLPSDLLSRSPVKVLTDLSTTTDVFSRAYVGVRGFADTVTALDVLAKTSLKSLAEAEVLSDYIVKHASKPLADLQHLADYVYRGVAKALLDAQALAEAFSYYITKVAAKLVEVWDLVIPEHGVVRASSRSLSEALSLVDLYYTSPILVEALRVADYVFKSPVKRIVDAQYLADAVAYSIAKLVRVLDLVIPEHYASKIPVFSVRDAAKALDLLKWALTVYGYALERPVVGDIIKSMYINNPTDLVKALRNMLADLWSRITSEHYPSSLHDLDSAIQKLVYVKPGDEVSHKHVNNLVVAVAHLYRLARDVYFKYSEVRGTALPEVERLLEEAYEIVSEPVFVKSGDIVMPEHFIQIFMVIIYVKEVYNILKKQIS